MFMRDLDAPQGWRSQSPDTIKAAFQMIVADIDAAIRLRSHEDEIVERVQHWRAVPAVFGLEGAPALLGLRKTQLIARGGGPR